jgi:hypothetical protein
MEADVSLACSEKSSFEEARSVASKLNEDCMWF